MTPETVEEQSPGTEQFEIRADQYSVNHYFIDTAYIGAYEPFYLNSPPMVTHPALQVVEAEVWVQREGAAVYPDDRTGIAWIDLPSRQSSGYDSLFRVTPDIPGTVESGRFHRLDPTSYRFEGYGYTGILSIFFEPVPDVIIAVAYRRADGTQYGDFLRDGFLDTTGTPMVLKMVKPRYLLREGPVYPLAWRMLLKNWYVVYHGHVSRHQFELQVIRTNSAGREERGIQGHPLLGMLGLDRLNQDGTPNPDGDGLFDFVLNHTILQSDGVIIFPTLRPFDTGIRQYFTSQGLPPPGEEFFFPELYDSTRAAAQRAPGNRYSIQGGGIFD
jgi:hypothetical protein